MSDVKMLFITLLLIIIGRNSLANSVIVAIDVGHSKQNPGATSARGKPEFEFNHGLALVVQQALTDHQINSFLIGEKGDVLDVKQRPVIANAHSARFFLSLHHDSAQPKYFKRWRWRDMNIPYSDKFSGFSLFVSRKNPRLAKSLDCARMIGKALQQKGFKPTKHHAEPICGENREWADQENGVYYYDDLVVLKSATMSAVLLEAGVIVNRNEEQTIEKPSTRDLTLKILETERERSEDF